MTQLYAVIRRRSKYYGQQQTRDPFLVEVCGRTDDYIFRGNDNDYRAEDLTFWVKNVRGEFVRLS